MFKRLSKSRRHSADDVGLGFGPKNPNLEESQTQASVSSIPVTRDNSEGLIPAALLRISRTKYSRRSCGDATAMQALLASKQDEEQEVSEVDYPTDYQTDYQMVTAVPAFIVEHEPEKQRGSSLGVWGRRMSKKIDSFRRAGSRETICSLERSDANSNNNNNNNNESSNNNNNNASLNPAGNKSTLSQKTDPKLDPKRLAGNSQRSPSPFKSFFIRMGSTGMLNSTRMNRRSQNVEIGSKTSEKENLFRSCSTSQLNTSPTYVKGDDPSEGIDLRISARKDKTVSCDDLAGRRNDDVFDNPIDNVSPSICQSGSLSASPTGSLSASPSGSPSTRNFKPCDFGRSRMESAMRKSSSCDFKEAKKSNFPYAFLRSKLSVLPEERHGSFVSKDERLFKTASEEHFPALKIEDSYVGTTTLGRKRSRNSNLGRCNVPRYQENVKPGRNSYVEFRKKSERYSLNPSELERIEDTFHSEDSARCNAYDNVNLTSLVRRNPSVYQQTEINHDRLDVRTVESRFSETSSLNVELDVKATLRNDRRNSAPSGEQRLSSHYVSSNESGYDSDGPRGESAAASENEALSLKCTDSSDTSSVIDSELEKPMRSSTPSECQDQEQKELRKGTNNETRIDSSEIGDVIDGLRWHQSTSGRLLPSIHQTSFDDANSHFPICTDNSSRLGNTNVTKSIDVSSHRIRLQQDKTRFLSDIIQPPKRVRRCRIVQLHKRDPKESLGIRLAQQRLGEIRYIVVQLESDGIAHRDGRLRLGDEIVEVEGKELRTLESLEEVQEFLRSFTGNKIRLMTAYEETVPQVYVAPPTPTSSSSSSSNALPGEYEYLENAKNLSNMSLIDDKSKENLTKDSKVNDDVTRSSGKRPDFLPLSCLSKNHRKDSENGFEANTESQHYLTKHVAKFEKGYGKPSLGFSVVGGRDSPRGEMGIFVRRVFPGGQADVSKSLFQGDEIVSLNGKILKGHTHQEVIELFKAVREGPVELEITRRHRYPKSTLKSTPY
ncbi:signal transducer and activator of transcription B-like isoform X1 [Polistes fuscatus]|uniref:signal transducer and activator of transcription B-like isoform X1 n=2 Tax=Polistes fuscatus TaxID=30207 RepID=UPI001CA920EA|nr:signal transducer and activator of transcription B-like isoform X1 [Polistes fuscatus]XP_043502742.1 signal transducer and activator of transcription B-like isoform X1 [Polistes fuscatus]